MITQHLTYKMYDEPSVNIISRAFGSYADIKTWTDKTSDMKDYML